LDNPTKAKIRVLGLVMSSGEIATAILSIDRHAALRVIPGECGQPQFDGRHRVGLHTTFGGAGRTSGDVEADDL